MRRWPWWRKRPEITRAGPYELRIEVVHATTRSQGRIGRLFLDDREIRGTMGDRIDLADGRALMHLGDERPHLWSTSGWALTTDDDR